MHGSLATVLGTEEFAAVAFVGGIGVGRAGKVVQTLIGFWFFHVKIRLLM